jgi:hypothetical protein
MTTNQPENSQAAEGFQPITHFRGTRDAAAPAERLRQVRAAAVQFREEMLAGGQVLYYRACDLVRLPYPTRYGLHNACTAPTPLLHLLNRMFVIQFRSGGAVKTLLVSPTDVERSAETPYFADMAQSFGVLRATLSPLVAPRLGEVKTWLDTLGISPDQVDYITFDHLHTQDLRKWLGTRNQPGLFPRAKLLVMQQEWESARALLPPQQLWYCPEGTEGVDPSRIVCLEGDVMLGAGVALIHTPGHTEGNHSIVAHTPEGLLVSSENGISADSYAPLHSRIPGVRAYAQRTGMEVILNGNTMERGLDQYISMVQEKEIAGKSPRNPDFYNVVPSSELRGYWMFPGIRPTFAFERVEFGEVDRSRR